MLKRLMLGFFKGSVIGAGIGAAFHFGLGWTTAAGLFAYLLAMGAGATAGILAGKPPWKQQAWIESILKAVAGLGVGALTYWVAHRWLSAPLPPILPSVEAGTAWTESTLAITTAAATVFGTLVELDNTEDESAPPPKNRKVRVATAGAEDFLEEPAEKRAAKERAL